MFDLRKIRRDSSSDIDDFLHRLTWGCVFSLIILFLPLIGA